MEESSVRKCLPYERLCHAEESSARASARKSLPHGRFVHAEESRIISMDSSDRCSVSTSIRTTSFSELQTHVNVFHMLRACSLTAGSFAGVKHVVMMTKLQHWFPERSLSIMLAQNLSEV